MESEWRVDGKTGGGVSLGRHGREGRKHRQRGGEESGRGEKARKGEMRAHPPTASPKNISEALRTFK